MAQLAESGVDLVVDDVPLEPAARTAAPRRPTTTGRTDPSCTSAPVPRRSRSRRASADRVPRRRSDSVQPERRHRSSRRRVHQRRRHRARRWPSRMYRSRTGRDRYTRGPTTRASTSSCPCTTRRRSSNRASAVSASTSTNGFPFRWRIVIADNASTDATRRSPTGCPPPTTDRPPASRQKGRGRALRAAWSASDADVVATPTSTCRPASPGCCRSWHRWSPGTPTSRSARAQLQLGRRPRPEARADLPVLQPAAAAGVRGPVPRRAVRVQGGACRRRPAAPASRRGRSVVLRHRTAAPRRVQRAAGPRGARRLDRRPRQPGRRRSTAMADLRGVRRMAWRFASGRGGVDLGEHERTAPGGRLRAPDGHLREHRARLDRGQPGALPPPARPGRSGVGQRHRVHRYRDRNSWANSRWTFRRRARRTDAGGWRRASRCTPVPARHVPGLGRVEGSPTAELVVLAVSWTAAALFRFVVLRNGCTAGDLPAGCRRRPIGSVCVKVGVLVVAYNAETTLRWVLDRIPRRAAHRSGRGAGDGRPLGRRHLRRRPRVRRRRHRHPAHDRPPRRATSGTAATRRPATGTPSTTAGTSSCCSTATVSTRRRRCPTCWRRSPIRASTPCSGRGCSIRAAHGAAGCRCTSTSATGS